jgi:23S rRNA pseudouridine2605 synthase
MNRPSPRPDRSRHSDRSRRPNRPDRPNRPSPPNEPRGTGRTNRSGRAFTKGPASPGPNPKPFRRGNANGNESRRPAGPQLVAPRPPRSGPTPNPRPTPGAGEAPRVGLARALSKLGYCSRREAWTLVESGVVQVDGTIIRDPEHGVHWRRARISVHGVPVQAERKVYLMLNKPRGLVTTAADEQGRATVFECLQNAAQSTGAINAAGAALPFVSPVGRLDKASEGLLLFTNDTAWADRITPPSTHLEKTYHVQVNGWVDESMRQRMLAGVTEGDEILKVRAVTELRRGDKNCWIEVVLDEGRNRHIRRILDVLGLETLRLLRVAIGPLLLGSLAKGQWRPLAPEEVSRLAPPSASSDPR